MRKPTKDERRSLKRRRRLLRARQTLAAAGRRLIFASWARGLPHFGRRDRPPAQGEGSCRSNGLPALGGQAVNSIIGMFCGLFANGNHGHQLTDGSLTTYPRSRCEGACARRPASSANDSDVLRRGRIGRWIENATVKPVKVAARRGLRSVERRGPQDQRLELGDTLRRCQVQATGFVDASGDAALVWQAGSLPRAGERPGVRHPDGHARRHRRIASNRAVRRSARGSAKRAMSTVWSGARALRFIIPGRGIAAMNMTHVETPLDPLEASAPDMEGRDQADRAVEFLQAANFPGASARRGCGPTAFRHPADPLDCWAASS